MNNPVVAAVTVSTPIALGVAMAIFSNQARVGMGAVRVAYFYPTLLPMAAAANLWLFIYTPMYVYPSRMPLPISGTTSSCR